jgi:hypothetical protein
VPDPTEPGPGPGPTQSTEIEVEIAVLTASFDARPGGVLRLLKAGCQWAIEFNGHRQCRWTSPDDAVMAAVRHSTGVIGWDRSRFVISDDLLRWRPVGENL